jgi:type IV pilus assembly protein PilE
MIATTSAHRPSASARPTPARPARARRRPLVRTRGFTLIEIMIVVVIIGILGAVAVPSYVNYLRRGDMSEAFSNLSTARIAMEQYYQDNRNYGASGTACGGALPTGSYFAITCATSSSAQAYTVTATGISGKRTAGYTYTIDHNNARATTQFAGSSVSGKACWLTKSTSEC